MKILNTVPDINSLSALTMQESINDTLDWIQQNEPSFIEAARNPDELVQKLLEFNPPTKDDTLITKEILYPLVAKWCKEQGVYGEASNDTTKLIEG